MTVNVYSVSVQFCVHSPFFFGTHPLGREKALFPGCVYNVSRGVVLKRSGGTPETRLRQRFLNNLGLHTRTLIHVRKIATADLWSCPAIQLLVFECL